MPLEPSERFLKLDSCAVSDALDSLGLKGVALGLRAVAARRRIAGRVVTVKLGAARDHASPRHLGTKAVESANAGDVIVVEHHSRDDVAGWGGILSTAAMLRGLAGTIVDGAVRDCDESETLGYPVFARAVVPRTARGRVVELSWNEPVDIAGVRVRPGDYVIADGSGVVFVSAAEAAAVIEKAEAIAGKEAAMVAALRSGLSVSQVMASNYETMLQSRAR